VHIAAKGRIADVLSKPQPEALLLARRPLIMCSPTKEPNQLKACDISENVSDVGMNESDVNMITLLN
jgi:hypothetical protein